MDSFRIDEGSERAYAIRLEEVIDITAELVQTLIEIDLQTFAESTFSPYTAAAFLKAGKVFLLRADHHPGEPGSDQIIGTCVCLRTWEKAHEATILSMGLRPGWRGQGLGQHFVQEVLDRLASRGMRSCSLLVGRENRRAIKLYEDVGFELIGEREVDGHNRDVLLLLRCRLTDDATENGELIELSPESS